MRQSMVQFCQGQVFSLAHLSFGLLDERAFFTGEYVVGINHTLGLDEHSTGSSGERHKIALLQLERITDASRNHHLAPLANLAERLLNCRGCFGSVSPAPAPDPR